MQIVSDYAIASANLAMALSDNTVSVEHRTAVSEAVGTDLDNMIDAVNTIISAYNQMVHTGKCKPPKAAFAIKAEYRAMGFNSLLDYSFLEGVVNLFFDRETFPNPDTLNRIKGIFQKNGECPVIRIKAGVDSYCLRLLTNAGLVTQDLPFTKHLLQRINAYSREMLDSAILPAIIVTEL